MGLNLIPFQLILTRRRGLCLPFFPEEVDFCKGKVVLFMSMLNMAIEKE
jgi:hypothetical protein